MKRKWLTNALTIAVHSVQIISPWMGQQHACQTDISNLHFSCSPHTYFWSNMNYFTLFDQNKPFSYAYISTTANPIDMIQSAVHLGYLLLNSSYFCRLSHEVFVKLSKPHFFTFFYMEQGMRSRSHICVRDVYRICIYYHIYMVAIPWNLEKI